MRQATEADLPEIRSRLTADVTRAMFPLVNLDAHGMGGSADRAMSFWLDEHGILGRTNEGAAMPVAPGTRAWCSAAAQALSGMTLIGAMGDAGPVRGLLAAAGLSGAPCKLDADEPQFTLDLGRMVMPWAEGYELVPLGAPWREIAITWRRDYAVEVLGESEASAESTAETDISNYEARDSHRILLLGGAPVAMTGFNAELSRIAQIGGVYTPPRLRGRGHARRAVALHLAEARERGLEQATLFASSDMAARCYRSLGFERTGTFTIVLFTEPQEVRPV